MAEIEQAGAQAPTPQAPPKVVDERTAVASMQAKRKLARESNPEAADPTPKPKAKPAPQEDTEAEQPADTEAVQSEAELEDSAAAPMTEFELDEIATALGIDPEELPDKLKIKLKDGSKATVREILQSQLRDADYRRKTMEHAEEVRVFKADAQRASEALRQRMEQSAVLEQALVQELRLDNAQLEKLLSEGYTDPMEYERLKIARDKRLGLLSQIAQHRQAAMTEAQNAQAEQAKQTRTKEQQALMREFPELKDNAKQQAFQLRIGKSLSGMGFSNDEVASYFSGTWDHRHIKILDKAAKYDELQAQKLPKKLSELPKVVKSGPGTQTAKETRPNISGLLEKLRHSRGMAPRKQEELAVQLLQARRKGAR